MDWTAFFGMAFCFALTWKWMDMRKAGPRQQRRGAETLAPAVGGTTQADLELARLKLQEQRERRALYEKLATEKLDVMRTAMAMGYKEDELRSLDARLERLIGSDKLERLMDSGEAPQLSADLLDSDLASEMQRLESQRAAQS